MQAEIAARLEEIIKYMGPYLPLANCHMVNFITQQLWEKHVPELIQNEVGSILGTDLNSIFFHYAKSSSNDEVNDVRETIQYYPHFNNFLESARNMSMRGHAQEKLLTGHDEIKSKLVDLGWEVPEDFYMEQFMTHKKMHEVEVMGNVVSALEHVTEASHIVDVGGGKGYLSSFLSLYHGLRVLGVDSSQVNTHGAIKRTRKLERVWTGLCRRADMLKQGDAPPRRGKHWKSHGPEENQKGMSEEKEILYRQVTEFQQFETDNCERLGIVGLHTCGDLASSCLRIFCERPEFTFLCNVGCCYHLMEEKHCRNPFWDDVDLSSAAKSYGFPMSQFLNNKEFFLGRNARMLAAQSLDRMGEQQEAQTESLYFRALLQVLLLERCGENVPWGQVGRLTAKCVNFVDYVQKALKRLKLDIQMTGYEFPDYPETSTIDGFITVAILNNCCIQRLDLMTWEATGNEVDLLLVLFQSNVDRDEIEALHRNHCHEQEKLHIFFLLRVSLAPVIETIILLDRLLYLHEQGVQEAHLIRLFDPVISPRCYCITAFSKNTH
ncbi:hypothetical protein L9F63_021632 [Diploptera punctata]|uniref:Methyltransferase domain-containing protein n=1 Tax=Diploptera punctata TaxID=6984 RepID=A0AAD7ZNZ1_DIPPU|nr:hypothetical protein L9F63_021632 [Diploptera punctata]